MMKRFALVVFTALFASVSYGQQWDEVVQRWPDGKPRMVNSFDGDRQGAVLVKRRVYFESGKIQMEMEVQDGLPHGHFVRYY